MPTYKLIIDFFSFLSIVFLPYPIIQIFVIKPIVLTSVYTS